MKTILHHKRTYAENTMSNKTFRLLIEERRVVKVSHNGGPRTGPEQYGTH